MSLEGTRPWLPPQVLGAAANLPEGGRVLGETAGSHGLDPSGHKLGNKPSCPSAAPRPMEAPCWLPTSLPSTPPVSSPATADGSPRNLNIKGGTDEVPTPVWGLQASPHTRWGKSSRRRAQALAQAVPSPC